MSCDMEVDAFLVMATCGVGDAVGSDVSRHDEGPASCWWSLLLEDMRQLKVVVQSQLVVCE